MLKNRELVLPISGGVVAQRIGSDALARPCFRRMTSSAAVRPYDASRWETPGVRGKPFIEAVHAAVSRGKASLAVCFTAKG